MRAKLPDEEGFVERDGVTLSYEIYGAGPETIVFLPPWSIVHSRVYKAQLPYFSERFRCIAFDGRGNGRSGRPEDVAAYSLDNYVADALAVMDATDEGKAIVVGLSFAGMLACILAAHYADRVKGCDIGRYISKHRAKLSVCRAGPFPREARAVRGLGQIQPRLLAFELSRFCRIFRS